MAVVLVLAGSLIVATERAGAQSATSLASNLDVGSSENTAVGALGSNHHMVTGSFTTGNADFGYTLDQVELKLKTIPGQGGSPTPAVALHSNNRHNAGPRLFTFTNPSSIGAINAEPGNFRFDAPAQTRLKPNTTYWVSIYADDDPMHVVLTAEDRSYDRGAGGDWKIGNTHVKQTTDTSSTFTTGDASVRLKLWGAEIAPILNEPDSGDLPNSGETLGLIIPGETHTGRMHANHDSGRTKGDWWKLRVEPNTRYRVKVDFASSGSTVAAEKRGGSIAVNHNAALWDHNRDDGLAFIEFVATSEPYYLRIQAKDSLNEGSATYFGPYTVDLDRIVNTTRKVSNTDSHTGGTTRVSNTLWKATAFTTGSHGGGYKLSYIGAGLHHDPDNKATNLVLAQLWSNENGYPSIKLFDFQRIGPITGHPTAQLTDRFWAPRDSTLLLPNTTYQVVFRDANSGSSYHVATVPDGDENPGAAAGWSIGDNAVLINYASTEDTSNWSDFEDTPILLEFFAGEQPKLKPR